MVSVSRSPLAIPMTVFRALLALDVKHALRRVAAALLGAPGQGRYLVVHSVVERQVLRVRHAGTVAAIRSAFRSTTISIFRDSDSR
ncbi:hypothetical protein GCM10017624_10130 [Azotobacter vinelandii]|nr:hypothetical protein GCM10017624_10130 [Azotobacter vinelandii]